MVKVIYIFISVLFASGAFAGDFNIEFDSKDWICNGESAAFASNTMKYVADGKNVTGECEFKTPCCSIVSLEVMDGVRKGRLKITNIKANYVMLEALYEQGVLNGIVKTYSKEGYLAAEAPYVNGETVGALKIYYPDGIVQIEIVPEEGSKPSRRLVNFPNGMLGHEAISEGSPTGKSIWYYSNGEKAVEIDYKDTEFVKGFCIDKSGQKKTLKEEQDLSRVSEICEKPVGAEYVVDKLRLGAGLPQPK
jgi:hypothetical protein